MTRIKVIPYKEAEGRLKEIYDDLIAKRGKLASVHTVHSLNPESLVSHMDLYLSLMFNHSPLSRANREMMAVVVSAANGCDYCQCHHASALNKYWKNKDRVELLKKGFQYAKLNEVESALCQYALDLTLFPDDFADKYGPEGLRKVNLNDRAILDATLVVAYFNFVNRIVLALHVDLEDTDAGEGYKY